MGGLIDQARPRGRVQFVAGSARSAANDSRKSPMDFALTDDQRAIQDAARAFAEAELAPHSAEWDETKHFPVDVMRHAAEMGFCGIYAGEQHGGMALGRVEAAVIFEELARGDVSTAAFISIHNM